MDTHQLYDDKTLFTQIAKGEEHAFRIFFDRYKLKLYHFILSIVKSPAETEELVQDVFLRLWISKHRLVDVENPGTYIFIMARNRALDHIRDEAKRRGVKTKLSEQSGNTNFTEEDVALKETRQLLDEAINRLPAQQQKAYRLSRETDMTREQIAAEMNISPNTVKNHLADALASIRTYMKGKDEIILLILLTPILGS